MAHSRRESAGTGAMRHSEELGTWLSSYISVSIAWSTVRERPPAAHSPLTGMRLVRLTSPRPTETIGEGPRMNPCWVWSSGSVRKSPEKGNSRAPARTTSWSRIAPPAVAGRREERL